MLEYIILAVLLVLITLCIARKFKSSNQVLIHNSYQLNTHRWNDIGENSLSVCCICHKSFEGWFKLEGMQCLVCRVSCHHICARKILSCKKSSASIYKDSLIHDWKEVLISKDTRCVYCGSLCGSVYGVTSLRCSWCSGSVHQKCIDLIPNDCNMGELKKFIIHPGYVKMPLRIEKLDQSIQPIVVVINPKSGGQVGQTALQAFYSLLNPVQVIDVFNDYKNLQAFQNMKDLRILVAGGDGTVAKLLETLYGETWKGEVPPVGIFPLGTGNDLSIVFNWGKGLKSRKGKNLATMTKSAQEVVKSVYKSYSSNLDRWTVSISSPGYTEKLIMCNYFGIGVDAKIAYEFHKLRETRPFLFKSRVFNK